MYAVSKTGDVNEVFWMCYEDGSIGSADGTIMGIHIGDTINYVATEDVEENERTIVSTADVNGFGNQTINLNDYTGTWRVLGVENGKLNIVSSKNAGIIASNNETWLTGVFASSYLKLKGKVGYQNAEKELNRVCSLYGKGKYAESARSINVDDINKITGYDPNHVGVNVNTATTEQIAAGTKYNQGILGEYGSTVSFFWDGTSKPKYTSSTINGNLKEEHNTNGFVWFNGKNWEKSNYTVQNKKICDITLTGYKYYANTLTANDTSQSVGIANNSNEWDLLFNNSKLGDGMFEYYWLASNGIMMNENVVWFGAFTANGGSVSIVTQLSSFGYDNVTEAQGLRPVVTLKSDIKIEKDANNIWQFIEN